MQKKEKVFGKLTATEMANIKEAKSRYAKRIRLYEEGCNLLYEVVGHLCTRISEKIGEDQDVAIITLCNRVIGTSKVIYELSMRGYQYDVNILVRSLFENSILLWYLARDKRNAEKWISGKIKISEIKKELGLNSKKELTEFYASLSNYVHSNFDAVFMLIDVPSKGSMINCSVEPVGLAESGDFLANFWAFSLAILSEHYSDLIGAEIKTKITKTIEKVKVYQDMPKVQKHNS